MAVDDQHVYWVNAVTGTIGESNLDGTDVNQSFITGASFPTLVRVEGQHIYWINSNLDTIGAANLDGSNVNQGFIGVNQSFITTATFVAGLAVSVPIARVTPARPTAFTSTPLGTLSQPRTLTITNAGQRDLSVLGCRSAARILAISSSAQTAVWGRSHLPRAVG